MALTDVTFQITPGPVGNQTLSDPTGSETPPPPEEELGTVTGLAPTTTEETIVTYSWSYALAIHDGFEVEVRQNGGAWSASTAGPAVRSHTHSGLAGGTLSGIRVRPYKGATNKGAWAISEQETDLPEVEPPPSEGDGTRLDRIFFFENFDYSAGSAAEDVTGFAACSSGVISTEQAYPGGNGKSMKSTVRQGHTGWTEWGLVYEGSKNGRPKPLAMKRYSETWFRMAVFYPSGWQWGDAGGGNKSHALKGFRHYRGSEGDDSGSIMFSPITDTGAYTTVVESGTPDRWEDWPNTTPPLGSWHMVESYVKWDTLGKDSGGTGELRFWFDGVALPPQTFWDGYLEGANHYTGRFMFHTYWNADSPATQSCYYDQMAIAYRGETTGGLSIDDTAHMSTDSTGFPFIGTAVE